MTPTQLIDQRIASYTDWRGPLLAQLRKLINESSPDLKEEWKWDTAVWTCHGLVCAISAFKDHVKINFFKGAQLPDPHGIINAGLESKGHRAIDFSENDKIDSTALTQLIHAAIALNSKK